jgi:hypothetical protein
MSAKSYDTVTIATEFTKSHGFRLRSQKDS